MIQNLVLYRQLMEDPVIHEYNQLVQWAESNQYNRITFKSIYYSLCSRLLDSSKTALLSITDYIAIEIIKSDNRFSLSVQIKEPLSDSLSKIAMNDLKVLRKLMSFDLNRLSELAEDPNCIISCSELENPIIDSVHSAFISENPSFLLDELCLIYANYGSGIFAFNNAFRVGSNGDVEGISRFDPQTFETLSGYEDEHKRLINNAQAFVDDLPYHHALLVGSSGTGKSTSIRALIPMFEKYHLKLIEIKKHHIKSIPVLFEKVYNRRGKFIFFLDDLTFEEEESDYKLLKSIIEGSAESIPPNVCFCVTSNRRHVIKESIHEREDQIHLSDVINENTSLSDRFGLYLHYYEPKQKEYLEIVQNYAKRNSIDISEEELYANALQFSRNSGDRSGRTAKQFITNLLAGLF